MRFKSPLPFIYSSYMPSCCHPLLRSFIHLTKPAINYSLFEILVLMKGHAGKASPFVGVHVQRSLRSVHKGGLWVCSIIKNKIMNIVGVGGDLIPWHIIIVSVDVTIVVS